MKNLNFSLLVFIVCTFANAQIVNIPDANFKAKLLEADSSNGIASTQAPNNNGNVLSYNIIDINGDGEIQVSEAQNISFLNIEASNIADSTGLEAFTSLIYLNYSDNQTLSLDVSSLSNLQYLDSVNNQYTSLNVSGCTNLKSLNCYSNQLTSLDVSGLIYLNYLNCTENQLQSLDVSGCINLVFLDCTWNQIQSLDVSGFNNLISLNCFSNQLQSLNVSGCTNLQDIYCSTNQLPNLNVSGFSNLQNLECSYNQLTSLNVSGCTNLQDLNCNNNQLTNLNVSDLTNLMYFGCNNNQLTSLNVSGLTNLISLTCNYNQLNSLFMKNNNPSWSILSFSFNPNLEYICVDEENIAMVQNIINNSDYNNSCNVNSYCSFTPGENFYSIQGNNHFDYNNNGCDASDINYPNLKFHITNGTQSGSVITSSSGSYFIPVLSGSYTLTPVLVNPDNFTVSPTSATVTFPTTASPFTQDFCISVNIGVHQDVEVVLFPLNPARPGFVASYKIIYSNFGNIVENGDIVVNYNANSNVMYYQSSSPTIANSTTSELIWNYSNLQPLETREINFSMLLNAPTSTPSLNAGDVLGFDAIISPIDDNYPNNHSSLKQTVVNSFDPNDKTCLEGNTINSSMIGEYLHYMIRFENTGTFPAENIVVKDLIDTTKFDVSTLQMTDASHSCYTRINGNKVEFIFENINLDFNDATNDGYVVFKIKTLPTLAIDAQVTNNANIYFDYNFPITTNTATSTFTTLANNSFDFDTYFTLAPIPAKDILTISNNQNASISSISIYNILGQVVLTTTNPSETIDVSSLKTGNYFIKIIADKGISSSKFIKE